ncbi:hypothetical protein ABZ642_44960 [Streptomyces sp. NPDC007157]|uniref:hypothetical protein n=1 Tax=Streptomyces sp. NPDC007157 TaxID=3154681 RepID=UPI0033DB9934
MTRTQILIIAAMVTVFAWSAVMAVLGYLAAVATLAPALGLAVQQIASVGRPQSESVPRHRSEAVEDKEGRAS